MIEKTHAEMQSHHYKEVANNPRYASEGLLDIRFEEMAYLIPSFEPTPEEVEQEIKFQPWQKNQWQRVQQLQGEVRHLHKLVTSMVIDTPETEQDTPFHKRKAGVKIE